MRQARSLVTLTLHGGCCLRRHDEAFAGTRYGKNVRAFLARMVAIGLAEWSFRRWFERNSRSSGGVSRPKNETLAGNLVAIEQRQGTGARVWRGRRMRTSNGIVAQTGN